MEDDIVNKLIPLKHRLKQSHIMCDYKIKH